MNNVEKILKKNKEVIAIVLLLVLVWMMYRKAGWGIADSFEWAGNKIDDAKNEKKRRQRLKIGGRECYVDSSGYLKCVYSNDNHDHEFITQLHGDNVTIRKYGGTFEDDGYCYTNNNKDIKCDGGQYVKGRKFYFEPSTVAEDRYSGKPKNNKLDKYCVKFSNGKINCNKSKLQDGKMFYFEDIY